MALTMDEYYEIKRGMRKHREDMKYYEIGSKHWKAAKLGLDELKKVMKDNHMIPKVGDLITDEQYPDDGVAVVLKVGDRRKDYDVYRVLAPKGPMWLNKGYVEYQCRLLS